MQSFRQELLSRREIREMRQAGLLVYQAHRIVERMVKPGVTTKEIDSEVEKYFDANKAVGCFKGVQLSRRQKPYPSVTCMSVNAELVHGIPNDRKLIEGDILSCDTGAKINGWCGDSAWTHAVGTVGPEVKKLMSCGQNTLNLAIELLATKTRWNLIAKEMADYVHSCGFHVVEDMVGHGIGHEMHQPPQVANYPCPGYDFTIRPGVVIAVEPMITVGTIELRQLSDGWTLVTKDHKLCVHYEHTIAITEDGPWVLTAGDDEYWNANFKNEVEN